MPVHQCGCIRCHGAIGRRVIGGHWCLDWCFAVHLRATWWILPSVINAWFARVTYKLICTVLYTLIHSTIRCTSVDTSDAMAPNGAMSSKDTNARTAFVFLRNYRVWRRALLVQQGWSCQNIAFGTAIAACIDWSPLSDYEFTADVPCPDLTGERWAIYFELYG